MKFIQSVVVSTIFNGGKQLGIIFKKRFYQTFGHDEGDVVQLRIYNGNIEWKPGSNWVPLSDSHSRLIS